MSAIEARQVVTTINQHLTSARALLLDLYQRQGWKALGYSSWRECAMAEFGDSQAKLYHELRAAQVETVLYQGINDAPTIGTIPERHLRPLAPYKDDPELVQEVYQEAVKTAPNDKLTATHVSAVVQQKVDPLAVHYSSESSEHYTPKIILDAVIQCLGQIHLDPCSNSHTSPNVTALNHLTLEDDSLNLPWVAQTLFMNPPYGKGIGQWVEKLCQEYDSGNTLEAIALVPARVDTAWFDRLGDYPVCFVKGRLKFIGNENSAPFPSAVFYLGADIDKFYYSFCPIGRVWQCIEPGMFGE